MSSQRLARFWKKWLAALGAARTSPRSAAPRAAPALDVATLEERILFSVTPLADAPVDEGAAAADAALALSPAELTSALVHVGLTTELQSSALASADADREQTNDAAAPAEGLGGSDPNTGSLCTSPDSAILLNWAGSEPGADENGAQLSPSVATAIETHVAAAQVAVEPASEPRQELVIVDANLDGLQQLLDSLHETDETRSLDIVFVDRFQDGFGQIDEALAAGPQYDAVHLLTHGDEGMLRLGNTWLDQYSVEQRLDQIQHWASSLASDADVLIYGCDFAASSDGQWLVDRLHEITGLDVAASIDATGNVARGGDWDLELQVGVIESTAILSAETAASWDGLLAMYTVTNTNDSGAGSLRQAILDANANAGLDTIIFNIGGGGLQTILVGSGGLPAITDAVYLDGTSQPGYSGAPLIQLDGTNATGATAGIWILTDNSTVRGFIVHSFPDEGIEIDLASNPSAANNTIQNCWIGIDSTGADRGNADIGLLITDGATGTLVGGTGANDRNIISGNGNAGIQIRIGATNNTVIGNWIGVGIDGVTPVGNGGAGIDILSSAANNWIGGTTSAEANIIAYNGSNGVLVRSDAGSQNAILGNSIFGNSGLGIDLAGGSENGFGVTANDSGDGDTGGNNLQNFAVLTSAQVVSSTQLSVAGTLNSTASSYYRIEFFATGTQDGSAHGEAQTFLGYVNVATNGSGNASYSTTLSAAVSAGSYVTATVTKSNATYTTFTDTSEFSQNCMAANTAPTLDSSKNPALSAVLEDAGAPVGAVGTLISQLADFASPAGQVDNATDADSGALLGIAITAANTNGSWFYSTNGGTDWFALGSVSNASARLLAADANTRLYFQPNANYNGTQAIAITFRAWDQTSGTNGGTADTSTNGSSTAFSSTTDNASLTVTAVNDDPMITLSGGGATASVNVAENATAVTTVTSMDVDGPAVSYSISGGADAALFTINSTTGALSFIAAPNYEAPTDTGSNNVYDVTVQVSDGAGATDAQSISVNVGDLRVTTDSQTTGSTTASSLTLSHASTGSDRLMLVTVAMANSASRSVSGITYNGDALIFVGLQTNGSNQARIEFWALVAPDLGAHDVVVNLSSANSSGTVVGVSTFTGVDQALPLGAFASAGGDSSNPTVNVSSGADELVFAGVAVESAANYNLSPGAGQTGHYDLHFGDANLGASTEAGAASVAMSWTFGASDQWVVGGVSIRPTVALNFPPVITSDGGGAAATFIVSENTSAVTTVAAADSDLPAQTITYSIAGGDDSALFSINSTSGALTFISARNHETPADEDADNTYEVIVQATDGSGGSDVQMISVTVSDADEFDVSPVSDIDGAANSVAENAANGTVVGITAVASDADATTNTITYTLDDNAGGRFTIDAATGVVTVANGTLLDYEAAASHSVVIRAASTDGSFMVQGFTIILVDQNDNAPVVTAGQSFAILENSANGTAVGSVAATDVDTVGALQSWSIFGGSGAAAFAIDSTTGQITVADSLQLDFETTTSFTLHVTVSDSLQTSGLQTVTINLTDIPGAIALDLDADDSGGSTGTDFANGYVEDGGPVSIADSDASFVVAETGITSVTVTIANRLDGAAETLAASTAGTSITASFNAAAGVLTLAGGDSVANYEQVLRSITYDNASQNADLTPRSITFAASSSGATSNVGTATISVAAVNDAPVAAGESFSLSNIDALTVSLPELLQNDSDVEGNSLTAVIVAGPAHGTLVLNSNGSFTYTPNENFTGEDSFSYAINDGAAASAPVFVQLTVTGGGGPLPPDDRSPPSDDSGGGAGAVSFEDSDDGDNSESGDSDANEDSTPNVSPNGPDHRRIRDYGSEETGHGNQLTVDARPRFRAAEVDHSGNIVYRLLDGAKGARRTAAAAGRAGFTPLYAGADALDSQILGLALHQMRDDVETASHPGRYLAGTVAIASAATTAGYVVWALRSAHLVTTFLATLPAWCHLDPLPLLTDRPRRRLPEDKESLLDIAEHAQPSGVRLSPQELAR